MCVRVFFLYNSKLHVCVCGDYIATLSQFARQQNELADIGASTSACVTAVVLYTIYTHVQEKANHPSIRPIAWIVPQNEGSIVNGIAWVRLIYDTWYYFVRRFSFYPFIRKVVFFLVFFYSLIPPRKFLIYIKTIGFATFFIGDQNGSCAEFSNKIIASIDSLRSVHNDFPKDIDRLKSNFWDFSFGYIPRTAIDILSISVVRIDDRIFFLIR